MFLNKLWTKNKSIIINRLWIFFELKLQPLAVLISQTLMPLLRKSAVLIWAQYNSLSVILIG